MITLYPFAELGSANFSWLQAKYHFSFSGYYNPNRHSFGNLRVINDDTVAPHSGFATHGHSDMEIITYVRSGAITHSDSMGNVGRIESGQVQVMSAGTGVEHSEYNHEDINTKLYQIWIYPHTKGLKPSWGMKTFPKSFVDDQLFLLVSGYGDVDTLSINQNATIHGGRLAAGHSINHFLRKIGHGAYILVAEGKIRIDNVIISNGDGAEITSQDNFTITAIDDSEVVVIEV